MNNAIVRIVDGIQTEHILRIGISYCQQRSELPFAHILIDKRLAHLYINFFLVTDRYEIDFFSIYTANGHLVAAP